MAEGHVCIAGLDEDGSHVRPVLEHGRLGRHVLAGNGGVFGLGAMVDLGKVRHRPVQPEFEDVVFEPAHLRFARSLTGEEFWSALDDVAEASLGAVFGDALEMTGYTASIEQGAGEVSLGVFRPSLRPTLMLTKGKPRLRVDDMGLGGLSLPVTDVRLFDRALEIVDRRAVELVTDRLRRRDALLSVGVGRAWSSDERPPRHWLQVNNIHLDDNPLWLI